MHMDSRRSELLEKYWAAETSIEKESAAKKSNFAKWTRIKHVKT